MFYSLKKQMFKRKWRKLNPHNFTNAEDLFEPACVNVGNYTYGGLRVLTYNKINKLSIGRFCSIAAGSDVCIVSGSLYRAYFFLSL